MEYKWVVETAVETKEFTGHYAFSDVVDFLSDLDVYEINHITLKKFERPNPKIQKLAQYMAEDMDCYVWDNLEREKRIDYLKRASKYIEVVNG